MLPLRNSFQAERTEVTFLGLLARRRFSLTFTPHTCYSSITGATHGLKLGQKGGSKIRNSFPY